MKALVTKLLNRRIGEPSVNAPILSPLEPGLSIEVEQIVIGDKIDGNDTWYKAVEGWYAWSGGCEAEDFINKQFSNAQNFWWLKDYSIPVLWSMGLMGNGVSIAILDTGVSFPHPDLILDVNNLYDVTDSPSKFHDIDGHGTHCIGIIKASRNETGAIGVAPNATIYSCKITNDDYGDDSSYLAKGIEWALLKNVDIISISNGSPYALDGSVERLIIDAQKKGTLIVCAAGNKIEGFPDNHIYYPARYCDTLSAGGIDENRHPLTTSILSGETKIYAPGKNILSTYKNSGYMQKTGSSQATPFVVGVCALIVEQIRKTDPNYRAANVASLLLNNADITPFGKIINPLKIINILSK